MPLYDHKTEELVYLAGDAPARAHDYAQSALNSNIVGHESRMSIKNANPVQVRYSGTAGERLIECDVYVLPGQPLKVHVLCPRCLKAGMINQNHTAIEYDPKANPDAGGRLSVAPFTCAWEFDSEPGARRMEFGLGLCNLRIAIDNNLARDA